MFDERKLRHLNGRHLRELSLDELTERLEAYTGRSGLRGAVEISVEKIQTLEKKKPGTMSKVFSTHPMTDDRIKEAQKNIQAYLKAKPEYVVTTSEFNDVKARLYQVENHRKIDDSKDANRPRLRRNPNSTSGPIDDNSVGGDDSKPKTDSDERPTLKRRDDSN